MKYLAAFAAAYLFLVSASQAVTWYVVTVSISVSQGGPTITKTVLNSKKYIDRGISAINNGDANPKNYFLGVRPDTGQVAVVHVPSKTVAYNLVSNTAFTGLAENGTSVIGTGAGTATVSSLNTDMSGYFYDKFTNKGDGSFKSLSRVVVAGSGTQTITGTIHATTKKFDL